MGALLKENCSCQRCWFEKIFSQPKFWTCVRFSSCKCILANSSGHLNKFTMLCTTTFWLVEDQTHDQSLIVSFLSNLEAFRYCLSCGITCSETSSNPPQRYSTSLAISDRRDCKPACVCIPLLLFNAARLFQPAVLLDFPHRCGSARANRLAL